MKHVIIVTGLFVIALTGNAQTLPDTQLKTLERQTVQSDDVIQNEDGPILLCFWATWCKPCIKELNAYNELYPDWKEETGVKIVLISTDNARSMHRVAPFVNGKGWEFDVYVDANSDLKRSMNVVNIPHTFLLNADKEVVWQHTSYMEGDEEEVFEQIQNITNVDE
ncbi:MAG: TlpA family protein disulfide reductase [Bacteroidota bacterium]